MDRADSTAPKAYTEHNHSLHYTPWYRVIAKPLAQFNYMLNLFNMSAYISTHKWNPQITKTAIMYTVHIIRLKYKILLTG